MKCKVKENSAHSALNMSLILEQLDVQSQIWELLEAELF